MGFIVFELFCPLSVLDMYCRNAWNLDDLEDLGSIYIYGKLVCLFVIHSSRFVNVFVITILSLAGGLFVCAMMVFDCLRLNQNYHAKVADRTTGG